MAATASAADIKRAYRRLVVQYHPDKHGGDIRYEEQFKAVAVAYGVLGDPGKRAHYDFQQTQAARRLDEERRRQQQRPATQHVYGVPMPPPAPLRTRPPAGSRERHYQRIPQQPPRFNGRDWLLTLLLLLGIAGFFVGVKLTMDHLTANSHYRDALRAYAGGNLAAASSLFEETLHFRPDDAATQQRLGELALLADHNPRVARAYLLAALQQPNPFAGDSSPLAEFQSHELHSGRAYSAAYYYLGRAEAQLAESNDALGSFYSALDADSTNSAARLALGELRLLDFNAPDLAEIDFTAGLALRQHAGRGRPLHYVQLRGVARAALGCYDEARADYFEVLQTHPTDGRTHFLLGKLAAHIGDSTAANQYYRRALQLGYEYARQEVEGWR